MDAKRKAELDELGMMAQLVGMNMNSINQSIVEGGSHINVNKIDPRELLRKDMAGGNHDTAERLITPESVAAGHAPMDYVDPLAPPGTVPPIAPMPAMGGWGAPIPQEPKPIFTTIAGKDVKIVGERVFVHEWRQLTEDEKPEYRIIQHMNEDDSFIEKMDWYEIEVEKEDEPEAVIPPEAVEDDLDEPITNELDIPPPQLEAIPLPDFPGEAGGEEFLNEEPPDES